MVSEEICQTLLDKIGLSKLAIVHQTSVASNFHRLWYMHMYIRTYAAM